MRKFLLTTFEFKVQTIFLSFVIGTVRAANEPNNWIDFDYSSLDSSPDSCLLVDLFCLFNLARHIRLIWLTFGTGVLARQH